MLLTGGVGAFLPFMNSDMVRTAYGPSVAISGKPVSGKPAASQTQT